MQTDIILKVEGLCKRYEHFALENVGFALPKGYIMGFIGPNGAGKTTTIKSILGMTRPDSGTVELFGQASAVAHQTLRGDIGVVMDAPFYSNDWTALDIERALMLFYPQWDGAQYRRLLERFSLESKKRLKELSRGMKVKLMMAAAMSHGARLLILDEPTSGLDPVARDELMDMLQEFIAQGESSVLFSTHITADLEKVADFITYIKDGGIIFEGEKDALLERYCLVKGGPQDLSPQLEERVMGLRRHSGGFEGLLETAHTARLPAGVLAERASLDEIIVYMNRGGK